MKSVYRVVIPAAIAAVLGAGTQARAFELDNLTARVRAIYIDPAEKSGAVAALSVPADNIDVQKTLSTRLRKTWALSCC